MVVINTSSDSSSGLKALRPGIVWVSISTGYFISLDRAFADGGLHYQKTTNGGATWEAKVQIDSATPPAGYSPRGYDIWYDKWTPGGTGTRIHIAWYWRRTSSPQAQSSYRFLDTANDTMGSEIPLGVGGVGMSVSLGTWQTQSLSIVKARGGNIYVFGNTDNSLSGNAGNGARSTDNGATFVANRRQDKGNGGPQMWPRVLLPGNEADTQDIYAVGRPTDATDKIGIWVHDDSANTWTAIVELSTGVVIDQGQLLWAAAIRHSDNHCFFAAADGGIGAAATRTFRIWEVTDAATVTQRTDIYTGETGHADHTLMFDEVNGHLYAAYWDTASRVAYRRSINGGVSWDAELEVSASNGQYVRLPPHVGAVGGRFQVAFFINPDWRTDFSIILAPPTSYTLLADLNDDGVYEVNLSALALTPETGEIEYDRGVNEELGHPAPGSLTFRLDNIDNRFDPENTGGVHYPNWTTGRRIQLNQITLGTTYRLYTGRIYEITPRPQEIYRDVIVKCFDGLDRLSEVKLELPASKAALESVLPGEVDGPLDEILDGINWDVALRLLDVGIDRFEVWFAHEEDSVELLRAIEDTERALIYVNRLGQLAYEDHGHRLRDGSGGVNDHLTPQATFTNDMIDFRYTISERDVRNHSRIHGTTRDATASTRLWGSRSPILVKGSATRKVIADFQNPIQSAVVPTSTTKYRVDTDPNGGSTTAAKVVLEANVSVAMVLHGQQAELTITNNNTSDVYLIAGTGDPDFVLVISGVEWLGTDIQATRENATSITAHLRRTIERVHPYTGNVPFLDSYAEYLVQTFKDPRAHAPVLTFFPTTEAGLETIAKLEVSDRIRVTAAKASVSARDYYINRLHHSIGHGGKEHTVDYNVIAVEAYIPTGQNPWLIGVAGFSEIGTTTFLRF